MQQSTAKLVNYPSSQRASILIHYVIYGQAQNNWILCTIKYSVGYDISVVSE